MEDNIHGDVDRDYASTVSAPNLVLEPFSPFYRLRLKS